MQPPDVDVPPYLVVDKLHMCTQTMEQSLVMFVPGMTCSEKKMATASSPHHSSSHVYVKVS